MSLDTIKKEVRRFLGSDVPEVLVLKGPWGVGKTYTWNKLLKEARSDGAIALERYSYVSLFGINSLDLFKFAIFEQQISSKLIGTEPNLETFKANTVSVLTSLGKKSVHFVQGLPFVRPLTPALQSVSFLSLSDTLICVDDFERKGAALSARDVLGLVSALKEQKKCKIALVLNDSSFEEDSLEEYEKYKEKVVDIELHFEPTAVDCVDIALDKGSPVTAKLREYIILLDINNIRLIKRVERLALLLASGLSLYEVEVVHQALHSLVLFSWSIYVKGEQVPSPEYLKGIGNRMFGLDDEEVSNQEKLWRSILSEYKYQTTDEFDLCVARVVETGFVDESALHEKAKSVNERIVAARSNVSFEKAWRKYHDSFNNDEKEVLDGMYASFKKNTKYISPINLNGTVKLFRDLKRNDQADELIEHYIKVRSDEKELFDLDEYPFAGDIDDKKIIERFGEVCGATQERKTLREALETVAGQQGWGHADAEVLSSASVDDFFALFKREQGPHLGAWVNACLKLGRYQNASERDMQIAAKATDALQRIAKESDLNARRVAKFGIKID